MYTSSSFRRVFQMLRKRHDSLVDPEETVQRAYSCRASRYSFTKNSERRETLPRMPGMWDKENLTPWLRWRFIMSSSVSLMKISGIKHALQPVQSMCLSFISLSFLHLFYQRTENKNREKREEESWEAAGNIPVKCVPAKQDVF